MTSRRDRPETGGDRRDEPGMRPADRRRVALAYGLTCVVLVIAAVLLGATGHAGAGALLSGAIGVSLVLALVNLRR